MVTQMRGPALFGWPALLCQCSCKWVGGTEIADPCHLLSLQAQLK